MSIFKLYLARAEAILVTSRSARSVFLHNHACAWGGDPSSRLGFPLRLAGLGSDMSQKIFPVSE